MAGLFLSFEGIDGCGKSTQAKLCYDALCKKDIKAYLTREPGGEKVAESIREILLFSREDILKETEVLLYAAARAQHVRKVIAPKLAQDNIVVCDRFVHSSVAYQGYGLGFDLKTIWDINSVAMGSTFPDIVFLFDLSVEEAFLRSKARQVVLDSRESGLSSEPLKKDRIENRGYDFYKKVRTGFLEMSNDPRITILDATKPAEVIHNEVMRIIWKVWQGGATS